MQPPVAIQRVSLATAGLLDHLDDDVFDYPVRAEWLHAFLANPSNLLIVALLDDVVIGMASGLCYLHPDKPLSLFINEVGVSSRHQRQGIGRQLMAALLEAGRAAGCVEAWVATEASNQPAQALYEALGGQADAEASRVYVYALGDQDSPSP